MLYSGRVWRFWALTQKMELGATRVRPSSDWDSMQCWNYEACWFRVRCYLFICSKKQWLKYAGQAKTHKGDQMAIRNSRSGFAILQPLKSISVFYCHNYELPKAWWLKRVHITYLFVSVGQKTKLPSWFLCYQFHKGKMSASWTHSQSSGKKILQPNSGSNRIQLLADRFMSLMSVITTLKC